MNGYTTKTDRIEPDHYEPSPPTNCGGVRVVFHITDGEDTHRRAELHPDFAKEFLQVTS